MTLCGIYGGKYSSKVGGIEVYNNKRKSLRLDQYLTESWNSTTS